jgi:hypothetical protein
VVMINRRQIMKMDKIEINKVTVVDIGTLQNIGRQTFH